MPVKTNEKEDSGPFYVKIIRAFPNNRFLEVRSIPFTSRSLAYSTCDDIQEDLDEDCDPARAYVMDKDGMPIRAGLARKFPPNYFFAANDRPRRRA